MKNPLSKFAVRQNLLFKIGLILIIVISLTSDVAVSRIAEEETEIKDETQKDPTISRQRATVPSDDPERSSENQHSTEFGLFNQNLFNRGSKSKHFIWQDEKEQVEGPDETETEKNLLIQPYLDSLRRWRNPPELTDLSKLYNWKPKPKRDEKGIALPMDSNLRITGLQSVTVEAKTHNWDCRGCAVANQRSS